MDWDLQTINEWKELRYYYEYEEELKQWRLYGNKKGLQSFVDNIEHYINNPTNNSISEHMHLGPHNYLKILTWHKAEISEKYIGGTFSDLKLLKELVAEKLKKVQAGEIFRIGNDYSPATTISILFFIMADGFDPSSIEFGK